MRRALLPLGEATAGQLAGTSPLVQGSGCLTWHATYETTGTAAASYGLFDGPPGSGQELAYVTLSEGQSTRDYIGLHALAFVNGLYYKLESGAVGGAFHVWVDHECEGYLHTEHLFFKDFARAARAAGLGG